MRRATCAIGIAVAVGCLSAGLGEAAANPADVPALYMPMDEGRILSHPASAEAAQRGTPRFRTAKRRTGLVIDSTGRSLSGLTVTGTALADPARGTIAFWMKPSVGYKTGRHCFVSLLSSSNSDEALHLFIERGTLFLQSRAAGKWLGVNFNHEWINEPSWRPGTWYHVAVTWGVAHPTVFYIDGRQVSKNARKLGFAGDAAPVDRIEVGSNGGGGQQADAVLDELLVFGDVLDAGRIERLMSAKEVRVPERKSMQRPSAAGSSVEAALPAGVKKVWDLANAHRQVTPTRERVCINGLWRWQPGASATDRVPPTGWGFFKVPGCWPGKVNYMQKDSQTVHPHPSWKSENLGGITTAWYQREITIPADWDGRRIAVYAEYLNSHASVFVDGRKAGEIFFPSGEADISSACRPGKTHVLSLYVAAMPLNAVMISYNDTASARKVKGSVARRGLCGDVFLLGTPKNARITDVRIATSVRKGEITLDAALAKLDPAQRYHLQAEIYRDGRVVKRLESDALRAADLAKGRFTFARPWKPRALWDTHTPGNVHMLQLSLTNGGNRVLDTYRPVRFGFREFWTEGRDFYLNGSRIYLSNVPLDNAEISASECTYEAARETMERLQSFGINFVYTHNFGCPPGAHLGFGDILRAADDVGMLVSFSQPHFSHYNWDAPDADRTNGYARHAEFYVRAAQNHPSVVFYSMSHNATCYGGDMDPDQIDGLRDPRAKWGGGNARKALRADAIVSRMDPSRIVYHHASGNLGSMHTINYYPNFIPVQEQSDWFEHWATEGVKPVFTNEYGAPYPWDWGMYRGWYKGTRTFGNAQVPWEFCLAEWNSQFLGDVAFKISEREKKNLRWEAAQFRTKGVWFRWDYPYTFFSKELDERQPVLVKYVRDNWRAFRTMGVSAISPGNHAMYWKMRPGVPRNRRVDFEVDWENLQRPGFSPDYLHQRYESFASSYERSDWIATPAARSVIRNNRDLLAYIAGAPGRFTEQGHNFLPGETIEKQIIVINNSRETVNCECSWSFGIPRPAKGRRSVRVETGQQKRIPLRFPVPSRLAPGAYELTATFRFSDGERQDDSFTVHVLPRPTVRRPVGRIALFDPKGETGEMLGSLGVRATSVDADADLSAYDVLVVGKEALSVDGRAPDIARVRDGLKVVMFEQTSDVLEQRLGFRVMEYGLRRVFTRVPDHPILSGLADEHLRDWRGEATVLPPRLTYETQTRVGPCVKWCGIPVPRLWRCGNRGNVASVLIEKPARGDFMPIADGGFSLQYSPLMEYREGRGMILFCQMDVTARTRTDPAAERIARNIFAHVSGWKPSPRREALYAGEAAGMKHLESAGVAVASYEGGRPPRDRVLVVGPGCGKALSRHASAIRGWLKSGGRLVAIGIDHTEANAFLPFGLTTATEEYISAWFEPHRLDSPFAGVGPADVRNRDPRDLPLVKGGATPVGNGVLASAEGGRVLFCQLAPWRFTYTCPEYGKKTFRRVSFLVTRLLAGMGVAGSTPLLTRFGSPLAGGGSSGDVVDRLWVEVGGKDVVLPLRWKCRALTGNRREPRGWRTAGFDEAGWRTIRVPGKWDDQLKDLVTFDGPVLYRTRFEVPAQMAGKAAKVMLGAIDDEDWTYVNGKEVGSITSKTNPGNYWNAIRVYRIPPGVLRAGVNVLAVKVVDLRQAGGILGYDTPTAKQMRRLEGTSRFVEGLYLDRPESWDDPYRHFRW